MEPSLEEEGFELEVADSSDQHTWPLLKIFDISGLVLVLVVNVRMLGDVVTALAYPSLSEGQVLGGATSVGVFASVRVQWAASWADLTTGVLLLGATALLVIPRLVWPATDDDPGLSVAPTVVTITAVIASLAATAALAELINILTSLSLTDPGLVLDGTTWLASLVLISLAAALAWWARGLGRVATADPADELSDEEEDEDED